MVRITESGELEVLHLIEVVRTHDDRPQGVGGAAEDEEVVEEAPERWWRPWDGIWADAKRSFDDEDEEEDSDVGFDEFDDEEDEFEADDEEKDEKDDRDDEDEDDFDDDLDEDE